MKFRIIYSLLTIFVTTSVNASKYQFSHSNNSETMAREILTEFDGRLGLLGVAKEAIQSTPSNWSKACFFIGWFYGDDLSGRIGLHLNIGLDQGFYDLKTSGKIKSLYNEIFELMNDREDGKIPGLISDCANDSYGGSAQNAERAVDQIDELFKAFLEIKAVIKQNLEK